MTPQIAPKPHKLAKSTKLLLGKEKAAQIKALLPQTNGVQSDPTVYPDEVLRNMKEALNGTSKTNDLNESATQKEDLNSYKPLLTTQTNGLGQSQSSLSPETSKSNGLSVKSSVKKPRFNESTQPNAQKCRYSPFAYHRYTRSHKEKTKDGAVIMVLRCRYCLEMQQVIIRFVLKEGRYIATKETAQVDESSA